MRMFGTMIVFVRMAMFVAVMMIVGMFMPVFMFVRVSKALAAAADTAHYSTSSSLIRI